MAENGIMPGLAGAHYPILFEFPLLDWIYHPRK